MDELDAVEDMFKGFFLLLTIWLWLPGLLTLKLYKWLT